MGIKFWFTLILIVVFQPLLYTSFLLGMFLVACRILTGEWFIKLSK